MNSFDELNKLKLRLIQYKNTLMQYEGKISTKKVVSSIDRIMEV